MVIANSAASVPEMMMGNSHSHAYKGKYQGKIIDCVPSERPFITTEVSCSSLDFLGLTTVSLSWALGLYSTISFKYLYSYLYLCP